MLPFKTLFFYKLTDEIELCEVVDKNGDIMTKVVANTVIPSRILDKIELIFNEARGE